MSWMNRTVRWLGYGAALVAGLALIAAAVLYIASERVLRRTYDVPAHAIELPTDSASIAEGRRLAILRGCYQGCHGMGLEGKVFLDERWVGRLVAPNLTHAVRQYSDAELERIIRHGVRPNGRSVFVMPSESFAALSDADLARILAYLRGAPEVDGPGASFSAGPLGRMGLLRGDFVPASLLIPRDSAPHIAAPPEEGDSLAFGRYLARSICTECHGVNLEGDVSLGSPNLVVVAAYSLAEFERLLRTGVPRDGRELGLMAAAGERFGLLTDAELRSLYTYLHSLQRSVAQNERR
jgi:mono/diheme cytochrome c family protein